MLTIGCWFSPAVFCLGEPVTLIALSVTLQKSNLLKLAPDLITPYSFIYQRFHIEDGMRI